MMHLGDDYTAPGSPSKRKLLRQQNSNEASTKDAAGVIRCRPIPALVTLYIISLHIYIMHLCDSLHSVKSLSNDSNHNMNLHAAQQLETTTMLGDPPRISSSAISNIQNNTRGATILVVYAGPSTPRSNPKTELYIKNMEYFLNYGIDCTTQDTVIVVGHDYYMSYFPTIQTLHRNCQQISRGRTNVILVPRLRQECYDMEAAYLTFITGGVPGLVHNVIDKYDYFFFVNCGVTGPPSTKTNNRPWTSHFTTLLDDQVKMTGLNLNCRQVDYVHIQSMMYAVDKIGLQLIIKSNAIFDCMSHPHNNTLDYIVNNYEKKMGATILNAGFALRPYIGRKDMIVTKANVKDCVPCDFFTLDENKNTLGKDTNVNVSQLVPSCEVRNQFKDIWMEGRLRALPVGGVGYIPRLDDVIFFKSSRWLPPNLVAKINYTGNITWHWPG
jgi:hypothetical protein